VFVDGCFWHGCPDHSPATFQGPNAEKWRTKIDTNQARDRRNDVLLLDAGWNVLRVWECDIRRDVKAAAQRVRQAATDSGQP
jgi:DNA mismatch endonuclease (patch repair protein)